MDFLVKDNRIISRKCRFQWKNEFWIMTRVMESSIFMYNLQKLHWRIMVARFLERRNIPYPKLIRLSIVHGSSKGCAGHRVSGRRRGDARAAGAVKPRGDTVALHRRASPAQDARRRLLGARRRRHSLPGRRPRHHGRRLEPRWHWNRPDPPTRPPQGNGSHSSELSLVF